VIGLSRSPRPSAEAQYLAADLLDVDALVAAVRSATPDAVVHPATAIPDRGHSSWHEGLTAELARPAHAA
jgi:hypothetical protein